MKCMTPFLATRSVLTILASFTRRSSGPPHVRLTAAPSSVSGECEPVMPAAHHESATRWYLTTAGGGGGGVAERLVKVIYFIYFLIF